MMQNVFYIMLLEALKAWGVQETTAEEYANAMSEVCTSKQECVRLASYAFVESARFAPWVLDNSCND